ncbi:uroporphyrinogen-III C-methyltransferase [Peristeroidobacter soli]|uniref:uroporphyrinogen-III C-methyltransferase n=1 Tax=Peristeroidobacter soli TaxID=2497877 RepID=UPI0013006E07|nr:uroporphyrinogen-III C-methyltransferase [Peristeroidobacter soli]
MTTAIAVLALAIAGYGLVRLDAIRDKLDIANAAVAASNADRELLRAELKSQASRERQAHRDLNRRLDTLNDAPQQLQELASSVEELRGRAEGPERAWSRAEALFLLELAQRRLTLDRDVETAIVALESADLRLASLKDPSFAAVRQEIAKELQALRAVQLPDTTGILSKLIGAEERASDAPVKGILVTERNAFDRTKLPDGMFARAGAILSQTFSNLIVVRKVDDASGSVITAEEALLRRQHLQLLFFAARTAVIRHDEQAYRTALAGARRSLGDFFDLSSPEAESLLNEVQALEPINIDPALPTVTNSISTLRRMVPSRRGPE